MGPTWVYIINYLPMRRTSGLFFYPRKKHGKLKNRSTVTSQQTREIVNINAQVE